jgi:RND family efflux transporter MFP subunit
MKRTTALAVATGLAGLIALGFVAGRLTGRSGGAPQTASRRVLYWVDPMHPAYKSDKPGIAPDCGMELEPVYEGDSASTQVPLPPGAVSLSAQRQQLIGIREVTVSRGSGSRTVRTTGRVLADENRQYKVMAGAEGWIESLEDNPAGTMVKKGQKLASLYSPEFRTAESTYLGFVNGVERLKQGMNPSEMKSVEDSSHINEEQLRLYGMGDEQLKQLRETHRLTSTVDLVAPGDGVVLARGISLRQRVEQGAELYRIADLSRVWIVADIHGNEGEVRPGTRVKVTVPELGRTVQATVSAYTPLFDESSRTLKLRLEADNPGMTMRPDMFADVEFEGKALAGLTIPAEAVLDSGLRKIVYVEAHEGVFEPRVVEIAGAFGDKVVIASGISEGDRIVVSGNFLLDSESRMRQAGGAESVSPPASPSSMQGPRTTHAAMRAEAPRDPVCGMPLKQEEVKFTESYRGKTFYLCSVSCREKFLANPDKYAGGIGASAAITEEKAAHSHD